MTSDFTGDFEMSGRPVRDGDMPAGVEAQPGVGDIEEQFSAVTRGFDSMHERVDTLAVDPADDPMVELDGGQDYDDIQRDAGQAARGAIDGEPGAFDPVSGTQPLGLTATMDGSIADIAADEFDVEGRP